MADTSAEESPNNSKSDFKIPTSRLALVFFFLTAASLIMAAIFNFTMAGYRSRLIADHLHKKDSTDQGKTIIKHSSGTASPENTASAIVNTTIAAPSPVAVAQPFPQTGSIQWAQIYPANTKTNILTISDATGNGHNKVIRINDLKTNINIANLYLQANSMASITLPATTYLLTMDEGDQWFGTVINFNEEGSTRKVAEPDLTQPTSLTINIRDDLPKK